MDGTASRAFALLLCTLLAVATTVCAAPSAPPGDARAIDAVAADVIRQSDGHRLLILGDLHGTREVPLLVGDVVAQLARRAPVTLALEMPEADQESLDTALAARTARDARARLLQRTWWRRSDDHHDGRRSLDMLDLIERMRRLRCDGRDVRVLAYDVDAEATSVDLGARDAHMAVRVRHAYLAEPARRIVMLTGNFHAFLRIPSYMRLPRPITTVGMRLADLDPASIRIGAAAGDAWGCSDGVCRTYPAMPAGTPDEGEYTGAVDLPVLHVGRLVTVPVR